MAGAALNKVLLIGNLVRDPELKYLPNGTAKAEMRLATSRTYVTNGEKREDTCFVDIIAWSRQAEICNQYLKKASKILVEGRLDYQEWEGQDGSKRSKHQVVADRVQFLDSRNAGAEDAGDMGAGGNAEGGAPRYQRAPQGQQGQRPTYAPRPSYAPPASAAPAAPVGAQAETGLAPNKPMTEQMGIADDDIPF